MYLNRFRRTPSFLLYKNSLKNVSGFLPLKEPLVAKLSETCVHTSRTNVAEKGMTIPNLSETLRLLLSHSSVFALEKAPLKC